MDRWEKGYGPFFVAMLISAASVHAQPPVVTHGVGQAPPHSVHPAPPPPPPAPVPPPPRSVPPPFHFTMPPLMPPVAGGLPPRDEGRPFRTYPRRQYGTAGYGFPIYDAYGFGYPEPAPPGAQALPQRARPVTGLLRLDVTPVSAQVFVDSFYVGTVEDINAQRALELEAGPHRIEIRAPDREPLVFDIRIEPYDTMTYRGALEMARPRAPVAVAPPAPSAAAGPIYVIPNCYLGNVPPRQNRLPAGCDAKNVHIVGQK